MSRDITADEITLEDQKEEKRIEGWVRMAGKHRRDQNEDFGLN